MNNYLVSVIIPTYDRGYIVERAIKSVVNQTYNNLEIIVVDDGSTDNTKQVVEEINDNRIIYICYQENKGLSTARNTGIKKSRGEFIAFLDSDDEYLPQKIEKSLEILKGTSSCLGMVGSSHYGDEKKLIFPSPNKKINKKRIIPIPSTWVLKKEVFKKVGFFNEGISITEDSEFFWRFRRRFLFNIIREPLVIKYKSVNRFYVNKEKIIKLRKKTIANLKKQKNIRLTARFLNMLGKDYRSFGKIKLARKYFLQAFRTYPLNFGYFINFLKSYKKDLFHSVAGTE